MKNILLIAIFSLISTGCVSTGNNSIKEPFRTAFYTSCMLKHGYTVTSCECQEKVLKEFYPSNNPETMKITQSVYKAIINRCAMQKFEDLLPQISLPLM